MLPPSSTRVIATMFSLWHGRPTLPPLPPVHETRQYVSGTPLLATTMAFTGAMQHTCFLLTGLPMANTSPLAIPMVSYTYGKLTQAKLLPSITAIRVLCAALLGLLIVHISPLEEIMVIALYRCGQLLPETICIPIISNIEFLASHGLLMVSELSLAALMAACKPGMLSQAAMPSAIEIIPARSTP